MATDFIFQILSETDLLPYFLSYLKSDIFVQEFIFSFKIDSSFPLMNKMLEYPLSLSHPFSPPFIPANMHCTNTCWAQLLSVSRIRKYLHISFTYLLLLVSIFPLDCRRNPAVCRYWYIHFWENNFSLA